MEVFNQRLEQEYNASVIVTAPTVPYKAILSSAKLIKVRAISAHIILAVELDSHCNFSNKEKFRLTGKLMIDASFQLVSLACVPVN